VASEEIRRPDEGRYYVPPWSANFLQGDIFQDVPLGFPLPPDAVFVEEGERRFLSGPFDAGLAMLLTPSCAMAAQGAEVEPGEYAHPARTLVPLRPIDELIEAGVVPERNLGHLKADRLVNYLYLPAEPELDIPESVGLLYLPVTVHHDVIAEDRVAQLTGEAFWHLRMKLMAFSGGFFIHPSEFGEPPEPQARTA
jgi:hypothetical protein